MAKGTFCISIDLELLWGRKDLDYSKFIDDTKMERKIIKTILRLFKKYHVSATWAYVGKLNEDGTKLWSGKDILALIKHDKMHELASHSYSHEIFSKIPRSIATEEIEKNKLKSFVFPRNEINHLDILRKNKFICFRGRDKSKYELLIPRIPPTADPKKVNGLVEIPSSMYFVSARGLKTHIPNNIRYIKSKLGIDHAISNGQIFHLWFHPVDFSNKSEILFNEFEKILMYANKKRNEEKLEIKTMQQIATQFLK